MDVENQYPDQPDEDDVRTIFLPGLAASAAQAREGKARIITPARLGTILVIVTALILGWLCIFGPLAVPLEQSLLRLSDAKPTAGFTTIPTIIPTATQTPNPPLPVSSPTPTQLATLTSTPLPTNTPTPFIPPTATLSPTPTSPINGCISSSQVTLQDVGKILCISGTVIRISAEPSAFYIFVEDPADAFYFVSYDRVWADLEEDTCIYATGEIRQLGNNPIMLLSYKVPLEYCPKE